MPVRPRWTPASSSRFVVLSALLAGAVASCGSDTDLVVPDAPIPSGATVSVNDTVTGSVSPGEIATYYLQPKADVEIAVFFQVTGGAGLTLVVNDSSAGVLGLVGSPVDTVHGHLTLRRTERMRLRAGRSYPVWVRASATTPSTFRLLAYRVNRAPEHVPATLVSGITLDAEDLENSADIDEFVFPASAADRAVAYLQSSDTLPAGQVKALITADAGETVFGSSYNAGVDEELDARVTSAALLPAAGQYRVIVQPEIPLGVERFVAGAYRLQFRIVDQGPESVPVLVQPGDTVTGERIDYSGDIDTFVVAGTPGQEANLFLQAGDAQSPLLGRIPSTPGTYGTGLTVFSPPGEPELFQRATGWFAVPSAGKFTVVVEADNGHGKSPGPYRLFPYLIDARPEHAEATLQPTDSVSERIDAPGDIDEFTFDVPQAGPFNFLIWQPAVTGGSVFSVAVHSSAGDAAYQIYATQLRGDERGGGIGRVPLPAGPVRIRVSNAEPIGGAYSGPYRLQVYALDDAPEDRASGVTIGQVVVDTIAPMGDFDTYTFTGRQGQLLDIVTRHDDSIQSNVALGVTSLDGTSMSFSTWVGPDSARTDTRRIGRFELPATGTYRITVGDIYNDGRLWTDKSPYQFVVHNVDTVPESVPIALPLGQNVTGERVDRRGDVDEFQVTAPAGGMVEAVLYNRSGPGERLQADILAPGSSTSLKSVISQGGPETTGPVQVPSSGMLRVRVYEPRPFQGGNAYSDFGTVGEYELQVREVGN